jgi:hypothetical protein
MPGVISMASVFNPTELVVYQSVRHLYSYTTVLDITNRDSIVFKVPGGQTNMVARI